MSRTSFGMTCAVIVGVCLLIATTARPQGAATAPADPVQQRMEALTESLRYAEESLIRRIEEQVLFRRLDDLADVDKVRLTGPPPRVIKNPTAQGAGNPVVLSAYTFLPKQYVKAGKLPLVVLVHGGVHSHFNPSNVHVLRELLQQGYAVLAPDYRGSTGYGKQFWELRSEERR